MWRILFGEFVGVHVSGEGPTFDVMKFPPRFVTMRALLNRRLEVTNLPPRLSPHGLAHKPKLHHGHVVL